METELQIRSGLVYHLVQYDSLTIDIIKSNECIEVIKKHIELLSGKTFDLTQCQKLNFLVSFFICVLHRYVDTNNTVENFIYIQKLIRAIEVSKSRILEEGKFEEGQNAQSKFIEILQGLTEEKIEADWNDALLMESTSDKSTDQVEQEPPPEL